MESARRPEPRRPELQRFHVKPVDAAQARMRTLVRRQAMRTFLLQLESSIVTTEDLATLAAEAAHATESKTPRSTTNGFGSSATDASFESAATDEAVADEYVPRLAAGRINYAEYRRLRESPALRDRPRIRAALTTRTFLSLLRDANGTAGVQDLLRRVHAQSCMVRTRATLLSYHLYSYLEDEPTRGGGDGSDGDTGRFMLRSRDLELWIREIFPSLHRPSEKARGVSDDEFELIYTATALRCLCFFLDPRRTGRVDLDRLCDSPVTAAFLEVGTVGQQQVLSLLGYKHDYTTHLRLRESWFAPDSARRVYDHYLELDVDRNGMLTKQELRMFQGLTIDPPRCFTKAFIDRFFEEVETHRVPSADEHGVMSSEIDYNAYLDFTLAIECMQSPEALRFLWRILDIERQGFIDGFTVAFFYRDIVKGVEKVGQSAPSLEDFTCELMDMVRPVDLNRFTLNDLINCRMGHTVVSILIDVNAFWLYENRENLMSSPDPEYDEGDPEDEGSMYDGHGDGGHAGDGTAEVEVEEL